MGVIIKKGNSIVSNRLWLLLYYILLVIVQLSWRDFDNAPGAAYRIGFMLAVMLPCYLFDKRWLPAVMTLFLALSTHGLSTGYMPARNMTFIVVMLLGLFLGGGSRMPETNSRFLLALLLIYTGFINLISSGEICLITESLILVLLFTYYIDYRDEDAFKLFSVSFIAISLSLSASLLLNADQVMTNVGISNIAGAERAAFGDINYSACAVSLGMIVSLVEIVQWKSGYFILLLSITTLIVSSIALAMNASRASILAVAVAGGIILWFSRTKIIYKVILSLLVIGGLYYMFTNEMFEVLAARIEMDDGTGTGRLNIWQTKIKDFGNYNILDWLVGLGHTIGREFDKGNVGTLGFHNDFVAFLVCYGVIGFLIIISLFLYPIKKITKNNPNRPLVIASLLGLFVICMTLEPFAAGRIPYYSFWLYIVWLTRIGEQQPLNKLKK